MKTLKRMHGIWAAVIEIMQEELRRAVVSEVEFQSVINRHKRNSLNYLQGMVREFMLRNRVAVVEWNMIEWEAKETSGDDRIDSIEQLMIGLKETCDVFFVMILSDGVYL